MLQRDHTCVPSCPRDFYGLASAKTCVTCAGAAANSTSCPGCAAGRWGSQSSLSGCTNCEPGKYAGGGDKASCEFCPRGWHGLKPGVEVMSECTPCTAGTWDAEARDTGGAVNASTCQKCVKGKYGETLGEFIESSACKFCEKGYPGTLTHGKDRIRVLLARHAQPDDGQMMMGVHESAWDVLPESINPSKRRRLRATVARKDTLSHWQTPLSATLVSLGSKHRFPTWCSAISVFQGHFQGVAAQQNALCVLAGHHKPKKGRVHACLVIPEHTL